MKSKLKVTIYGAEHIEKRYKIEMRKVKNKYFKETLQLYLSLCEYLDLKPSIEPKLKEGFFKAFFEANSYSEANDLAIDYIINYDEYMAELFEEIKILKNKVLELENKM